MNNFLATKNDEGRTILKYLEKILTGVPKSKIEKMFRNKDVLLNGTRTKDKTILINEGDQITIYGVRFSEQTFKKVKVEFKVVFEDDNILVIDKPVGAEVHGPEDSLDNQVISYLKFSKEDSFVPSHIGRLDKVTSGLMIYAKNYKALREFKEKNMFFSKYYIAKTKFNEELTFSGMIYHDEDAHKEVVNEQYGKEIEAGFKPLGGGEIEVHLITGRKHQIRANLEFLKAPILGDTKYGGLKSDRVYLHSYKIVLNGLENDMEYLNGKEIVNRPNW